jgi:hypothetical protein
MMSKGRHSVGSWTGTNPSYRDGFESTGSGCAQESAPTQPAANECGTFEPHSSPQMEKRGPRRGSVLGSCNDDETEDDHA